MGISINDFSKEELLRLLNESGIGIVVSSGDLFSSANSVFLEMTGLDEKKLAGYDVCNCFSPESCDDISFYKKRILENIRKNQVVRSVDRKLAVELRHRDGRQVKCLLILNPISRKEEFSWLYQFIELPSFHNDSGEQRSLEKMVRLKDYLLNISQSLVRLDDIQNFYSLVLEAADKTIGQAEFCAIMRLVDGEKYVPVATRGYSWSVMEDFELPVKDSFSWLKLGHLLDRTIIVDDVYDLTSSDDVLVEIGGYKIRSTLQTPIFLNNELYGILSIDSSKVNAFSEDDFNSIEYLRTQIQIGLENQLLYNKMHHQASHDKLTGVASRGSFEEQVIQFLRSRHYYESCCIIMMDVNDLKTVNDNWGHSAGDRMLLEFINALQQHMRGTDLLARLGGDEFAICFFSSQSAQFIERLAEIQQHFTENPLDFDGRKVSCYFSYGIAFCPEDGESYDMLMNKADRQMYAMKARLKSKKRKNDLLDLRQNQ